jgi:hypothetical protein
MLLLLLLLVLMSRWFGYAFEKYKIAGDDMKVYSNSVQRGKKGVNGLCRNVGTPQCDVAAAYCHNIPAEMLEEYALRLRQLAPKKFKS